MILVLDSRPLIALARIGRLNLIPQLAEHVYVPTAVYEEVAHQGANRVGSMEISEARWIISVRVRDQAAVHRLLDQVG